MNNSLRGNYLFLIWKDPRSRRNYTIGRLTRSDKYYFEYCGEYKEALKAGWYYLSAFPEVKVYESASLFAAFLARLPDPKRKGIDEILRKYDLSEYDGYELLRKSTGRLPIDTYEFIDPIFPEEETVQRNFYVVGIRHVSGCEGNDCEKMPVVKLGDGLELIREPDNLSDKFAVRVLSSNGEMLGYVPRYYSESVATRLEKGMTYSCNVIEIHEDRDCENCLKVCLRIPKEG